MTQQLAFDPLLSLGTLADHVAHAVPRCDERIISAFRSVPRQLFVPEHLRARAYEDVALPIGWGQTISQPSMVAIMLAELGCTPHSRVLEVGGGSGYAAALLSHLASSVYGIERHPPLALRASETIARLGYRNVAIECGDGTAHRYAASGFDRILVSAAAASIPPALLAALPANGRLVMPVGNEQEQLLITCERDARGKLTWRKSTRCIFVPLISGSAAAGND
jgi:protein-L-isoaspartate(D-aspartate) O-methyltransferase